MSPTSTSLIVIPGFLSEPHALAQQHHESALNQLDPTAFLDRRSWENTLRALCNERVNLIVYQWPGQSATELFLEMLTMLLSQGGRFNQLKHSLLSLAQELYTAWFNAVHACDAQVEDVTHLYQELCAQGEVYVLGHSLGGRLALKALELHSANPSTRTPKVSAWAPALNSTEMKWTTLNQLKSVPEIMYSQADQVLKLIYPLAQNFQPKMPVMSLLKVLSSILANQSHPKAIGLVGPPPTYPMLFKHSIDLTSRQMNHLGYLPSAEYLFGQSRYLGDLRSS